MAHMIPTSFTAYQLNHQEQVEGSKFTITQKQVIQNHIADLAEQLLTLEPDTKDVLKFAQQQAHFKGGIASLKYLLAVCEAIEEEEVLAMDLRPEVD
jgi:hypothetical protein